MRGVRGGASRQSYPTLLETRVSSMRPRRPPSASCTRRFSSARPRACVASGPALPNALLRLRHTTIQADSRLALHHHHRMWTLKLETMHIIY